MMIMFFALTVLFKKVLSMLFYEFPFCRDFAMIAKQHPLAPVLWKTIWIGTLNLVIKRSKGSFNKEPAHNHSHVEIEMK